MYAKNDTVEALEVPTEADIIPPVRYDLLATHIFHVSVVFVPLSLPKALSAVWAYLIFLPCFIYYPEYNSRDSIVYENFVLLPLG